MKIRDVVANGRRRAFEVHTSKRVYLFPYVNSDPKPGGANPVVIVLPDPDFGNEAFTYELKSGEQGTIHLDSVLEINEDPKYMADLILYKLSLEAKQLMESSGRTARDLAEELGTSPAQLYRLLDPTNYTKSFRQLTMLLNALGCSVDVELSSISRPKQLRPATPKLVLTS
jgi:hypothetical protein